MKTVEQYINTLGTDELKDIAREKFNGMISSIEDTLKYINRFHKMGINSPNILNTKYLSNRERLQEADLWDSKYDEWYELAIQGKLNTTELVSIKK